MQTRDSIEDVWGPRSPYFGEASWPARVDERTAEEPDRWVQSCCVLCINGCRLEIGLRRVAVALLKRAPGEGTTPTKRLKAGWDDDHLPQVLQGIPANIVR